MPKKGIKATAEKLALNLSEVKHMNEKNSEIAEYLYNEIDNCDNCPLERICDRYCEDMWLKFLTSKDMVKEGD